MSTLVVDERNGAELRRQLIAEFGDSGTWWTAARRRRRAWRVRASWRFSTVAATGLKRSLDIVVSALALIALSPLLAIVALAIKRHDRGPVLFWQARVGRWGAEFRCPKFRSMVVDAEAKKEALLASNDHGASVTFKMKRDPRVTPIGRFIRKLSIDELPQLWCVLKGEMSLVGPRPPVPREVALYTLSERRRLDAKPGLTCVWQVSGRGDLAFDRQVELDVDYIQTRCLRKDFNLLVKTIPAVLSGRGAY